MARRYDFDWLRTFVILDLIPFHVIFLMIYIPEFSQVSTTNLSAALLSAYCIEVMPWHMPLLFLIAGYSAALSLSKRSLREYSVERFQRLVIPFVFFMTTIGLVSSYFFPTRPDLSSLTDFIFNYLPDRFRTLFHRDLGIHHHWQHLWFVAYLLVFNLTALPILLKIGRYRIKAIASKLDQNLVCLPMVIFGGIMATLGYRWPLFIQPITLIDDWSYFAYNLFAFIIGYLLFVDEGLGRSINCKLRLWLVLSLVSSVIRLVLLSQYQEGFYDASELGRYLLCSLVTGVHTWSQIALMLALAHRYLANTHNPWLTYMNKASFPFYILHLPITVILGVYITPLGLKVLPEFLLLTVGTAVLTVLTYEFLVKPWSFSQMLFGVK